MVIVITGYASVSSAVEVMKMGAFDYLPKPFTPEELRGVVRQAVAERAIQLQNRKFKQQQGEKVIEMVRKVAPTDSTVLISGESGTGKELIARAIHANSKRGDKSFFAVDCGTISAALLESELFGHTKGAFTGAHRDKPGIFKVANGGTVFLDEIGNITLEVQAKLLRFLEGREFLPLGSTTTQTVDVRLILATNQDLKEMVSEGSFREDFYYRIFVYPIAMPPLRERKEDILPIAYHFLEQFNRSLGKNITGFDSNAVNKLTQYDWPGNVRQLRNAIERAIILCDKELISLKELPFTDEVEQLIEQIPSTNEELKRIKKQIRQRAVGEVEKNFVINALALNNWNVTQAAKKVGLQRPNFQNLMKKHGIKLQQSVKSSKKQDSHSSRKVE
jgi:DNA-binding NtrC family response regulator